MKVGEVIFRIQHLYSKGTPSDDSRLSNRHIYNKLVSVRSRVLAQEINKRRKISSWNIKVLPCVELIEVSSHECECLPDIGCGYLRSKYRIPKPIISYSKHYITKVSSIDGSIDYYEKDESKIKYSKGNKYSKSNNYYFIRDGYIYTPNIKGPRIIKVEGVFEDQVEVNNFISYCASSKEDTYASCKSILEDEFEVEADLIDYIIELSVNELVAQFSQGLEDKTNNSSDSHIQRST